MIFEEVIILSSFLLLAFFIDPRVSKVSAFINIGDVRLLIVSL